MPSILRALGVRPLPPLAAAIPEATSPAAMMPSTPGAVGSSTLSPWADDSHLRKIAWADVIGLGASRPVDRALAMSVAPVARVRHLIAGTIAALTLRAYRGDDALAVQPTWTTSTSGALSAFHRMLWTIDDLLFTGWSCWRRTNGANGYPLQLDRITRDQWRLDAVGRVELRVSDTAWRVASSTEVVLIPGPHEGWLTYGQDVIRHAADLAHAARRAAETPSANVELHQTEQVKLTDDEVDALLSGWTAARRGENGGVAFTSYGIEAREHGSWGDHLVTEGRNAAAVDVARSAGINADMIDAKTAGGSLTYSTIRDRGTEFVRYGLGLYMRSVSARLSLDDVCPQGQRIGFDLEEWLGPDPSDTPAAQQQPAPAAGALDPAAGPPSTPDPDPEDTP